MKDPTKVCKCCNEELPLHEYANEPRNKDGKNGKCRSCVRLAAKAISSTPEYKANRRLKRQDPERKAKKAISDKAYRERLNKEKPAKEVKSRLSDEERKRRKANSAKTYAAKNKERIAEYQKQYRVENTARLRDSRAKYVAREEFLVEERARRKNLREREPGRIKEDKRREYLENIDRYKKSALSYRNSDKGKVIAVEASARYRSKRDEASDGTITVETLRLLKEVQGDRCAYCLADLSKLARSNVHLDHIYPISKGGLHSITNIVWSCAECNLRKNAAVEGWAILTNRIVLE